MKRNLVYIIILLFILLTGCTLSSKPISKTNIIMGTIVDITIYNPVKEKVFESAFNRLKEIEAKMSINLEKSEAIEINKNAGKSGVKVSEDTFYVIKKGLYYSNLSKGKFDITIGPLVKLWGIGSENAKVPHSEEINKTLKLINYNDLFLNENEKKIILNKENMMLDLGAIAKGYAADEVVKVLKEEGIKNAIISIGGNVMTLGENPNGHLWQIGIQDPLSTRGNYVGILKAKDLSIVSSGIYERFLEVDNKKYHHILDTKTGYPVENNLLSVTIINKSSIDGDSLSTTAFAMGLKEGFNLIQSMQNTDAVFITKDKKVYITKGIKNQFTITNNEYTLIQ